MVYRHLFDIFEPLIERFSRGIFFLDNGTNLQNKGLISADRGAKATLMLTIPRSLFKSSTKDLSTQYFELEMKQRLRLAICARDSAVPCYDLGCTEVHLCLCIVTLGRNILSLFSMDSGLEAFSRNPTHGSFSALTFQSTEFANYANQRFLSY